MQLLDYYNSPIRLLLSAIPIKFLLGACSIIRSEKKSKKSGNVIYHTVFILVVSVKIPPKRQYFLIFGNLYYRTGTRQIGLLVLEEYKSPNIVDQRGGLIGGSLIRGSLIGSHQRQASGLMGSPTDPHTRREERSYLAGISSPIEHNIWG
jgi:hypothetical protein